ncbi:beta-microseminoprotein-like [Pseudophryne corroboree]|uniref:beta-microseminoprotein-like n=1 Tax=Pseudophryne corroboree TaxID=495146 RepID=UPI003081E533
MCNAQCFMVPATGCYYKGRFHVVKSSWNTTDCNTCQCLDNAVVACCSRVAIPTNFDTKNCHLVFDKGSCSYKLISNKDPKIKCEITSAVE